MVAFSVSFSDLLPRFQGHRVTIALCAQLMRNLFLVLFCTEAYFRAHMRWESRWPSNVVALLCQWQNSVVQQLLQSCSCSQSSPCCCVTSLLEAVRRWLRHLSYRRLRLDLECIRLRRSIIASL